MCIRDSTSITWRRLSLVSASEIHVGASRAVLLDGPYRCEGPSVGRWEGSFGWSVQRTFAGRCTRADASRCKRTIACRCNRSAAGRCEGPSRWLVRSAIAVGARLAIAYRCACLTLVAPCLCLDGAESEVFSSRECQRCGTVGPE